MQLVGESQVVTEEQHSSKFQEARTAAQEPKKSLKEKRNFPQVSFTISQDDKKLVDEMTIFATNKKGKIVQPSAVIRALIRYGKKHIEEVEFE